MMDSCMPVKIKTYNAVAILACQFHCVFYVKSVSGILAAGIDEAVLSRLWRMFRTKDELRQEVARITVELESKQDEESYLRGMLRRVNNRYKHAKRTVFPLKYYMLKRLVRLAAKEPSTTMPDRQGWKGLGENFRDLERLQELKEGLKQHDKNSLEQDLRKHQTTLAQLNLNLSEFTRLRQDIKQLYTESRQRPMRDRYIMLKTTVKRVARAFGSMKSANGHTS